MTTLPDFIPARYAQRFIEAVQPGTSRILGVYANIRWRGHAAAEALTSAGVPLPTRIIRDSYHDCALVPNFYFLWEVQDGSEVTGEQLAEVCWQIASATEDSVTVMPLELKEDTFRLYFPNHKGRRLETWVGREKYASFKELLTLVRPDARALAPRPERKPGWHDDYGFPGFNTDGQYGPVLP